jgi:hypothetical protein
MSKYQNYFKQVGEHIVGNTQYVLYQPVGYALVLKSGNGRVLASVQVFYDEEDILTQKCPIPVPFEGGFQIIFQSGNSGDSGDSGDTGDSESKSDSGRPIKYIITSHCKESAYIKIDLGYGKVPSQETDPVENINNINELKSFESVEIKSNQLDGWKQLMVKTKKKKNSLGVSTTVSLQEEQDAVPEDKVGTYLYLTVTPQDNCSLSELFKDSYWSSSDLIIVEKNYPINNLRYRGGDGDRVMNPMEGLHNYPQPYNVRNRYRGGGGDNEQAGQVVLEDQIMMRAPGPVLGNQAIQAGRAGRAGRAVQAVPVPNIKPSSSIFSKLFSSSKNKDLTDNIKPRGKIKTESGSESSVGSGSESSAGSGTKSKSGGLSFGKMFSQFTCGKPEPVMKRGKKFNCYDDDDNTDGYGGCGGYDDYNLGCSVRGLKKPGLIDPRIGVDNESAKGNTKGNTKPMGILPKGKAVGKIETDVRQEENMLDDTEDTEDEEDEEGNGDRYMTTGTGMDDIISGACRTRTFAKTEQITNSSIMKSKVAELVGGDNIIQQQGNKTHMSYDYSVRTEPRKIGLSVMDLSIVKVYPVVTPDEIKTLMTEYLDVIKRCKDMEFVSLAKSLKKYRSDVCTVCLDQDSPPCIVLVRCGHVCTCSDECAEILNNKCPMCRADVLCKINERVFLANC